MSSNGTATLSLVRYESNWPDSERATTKRRSPSIPLQQRKVNDPSNWAPSSFEPIIEPDMAFAELERVVRKQLGFFAARRTKRLAGYKPGWDGKDAKSLAAASAALFAGFLRGSKKFPSTPSLFLTREGYFAMSWESRAGDTVHVTFETDTCRVDSENLKRVFQITRSYDLKNLARSLV